MFNPYHLLYRLSHVFHLLDNNLSLPYAMKHWMIQSVHTNALHGSSKLLSEKPTSAEEVGVDRFHGGTSNGMQWQARSANKSLAQHVTTEAQAKTCFRNGIP